MLNGGIVRAFHWTLNIEHYTLLLHPLRRFDRFLNSTHHEEGLLGQMVVLALDDLFKAAHGISNRHVLARFTRELLADEEGLRHELLNAARARDCELVLFRQLVDTKNRDDVLEILVP